MIPPVLQVTGYGRFSSVHFTPDPVTSRGPPVGARKGSPLTLHQNVEAACRFIRFLYDHPPTR